MTWCTAVFSWRTGTRRFRPPWSMTFASNGAAISNSKAQISPAQCKRLRNYGLRHAELFTSYCFPGRASLAVHRCRVLCPGRHALKAGIDVSPIHELLINLFQGGGIYSYSGNSATALRNWIADAYGVQATPTDTLIGKHYSNFTQATDPITGVGRTTSGTPTSPGLSRIPGSSARISP